ncbi:polysaccharide ABC transporter ATP-binding protein [Candidatus Protochlamydia amoebophila]|uniref:O-antigen export system ATP-binding protein RfbB n=1 Tax=Candidatus Protochlamydia amoebophila TaxID=362787 RepID=A0A0C1JUC3_9BACT|nr:ABC transporter ATP-binding protein [Candidatus Protochlamydia amoebophila]KIC74021.1 O-antigen export system ATP-binding protein RfbB [Candidatus Protochlamydia amoebophila]
MNIVEIEQLSKKYLISHENQNPYASLKEIATDWFKNSFKRLTSPSTSFVEQCEEFWAVQDINLNIQQGDRIALLGRNGAGKSTLLKLISRITEPTTGKIKIRGRVSCLLEVGTGFHPDLTGRENIFLNGAIMGMSYQEIQTKFDEIVDFAEIEKFLDTPIKKYSSGMYMRLGFAIAAHLNSDLLIVDEVLAVGDAQFQEKCIKKMNEMGMQGSTVLFVSHSVSSVLSLCNKGAFLEKGRLKALEPIETCVNRYINSCPAAGLEWKGTLGDEHVQFFQTKLSTPKSSSALFFHDEQATISIDFEILKSQPDLILGISILNSRNQIIARSRLCDHDEYYDLISKTGRHHLNYALDPSLFHPGEYQIRLECSILNKKKILQGEILLKFIVYSSQIQQSKYEFGTDKDGISLGNRWFLSKHL